MAERSLHGAPARFAGGLQPVADGVWAWLQPNGDWGESNAGLVTGGAEALLVDTLWDERLTRRLLEAVERVAGGRPGVVLHTHGDGDHVYGDGLLPEAEIVASAAAAHDMGEEDPRALARMKRLTGVGRRVPVGPVRELSAYVARMLGPFDLRAASVRAPTRTFERELDLEVGGRLVRAEVVGPAHTAGDTIVVVPDAGVVFAGDVLFSGVTPNAWTGPVSGWRRALERVAAHEPRHVVPGHGPVGTLDAVAALDAYWGWVQEAGGARLAGGDDPAAAARALLTDPGFATLPWGGWDSPERLLSNLIVLDRERRGVPTPIAHKERPRLMRGMAALRAALPPR